MQEVKHYKVKALPSIPSPNSVYYVKATTQGEVKTYITDQFGQPFPLIDLNSEGITDVNSVTGTGVTGTAANPVVNITTFKSSQLGNILELSSLDGKLFVKPITSPDGSIDISSTTTALEIQLSETLQALINSAIQSGDNISELTNDAGYITLGEIPQSSISATAWTPNHTVSTGNPYLVETLVYYSGNIFQANFNNDSIIPTIGGNLYWTDLGPGYLIDQEQTDWTATGGPTYLKNRPTSTSSFINNGDGASNYVTFADLAPLTVGTLPPGGTAGQILTKVDSVDYNTIWQDNYADWTSVVKHIVKNDGTGLITKGTPVYSTGSNGTNILVRAASNTSEASSSKTMGLMQTNITTTGGTTTGFVIAEGLLGGLDTAGQIAGDPVWLGPNGTLIYGLINKPYAPAHLVFIGIVTKISAGNGEIFVKIQNGFELEELHNVDLKTTVPANGEVLGFDGTLWKNKTIATALGYTPADANTDLQQRRKGYTISTDFLATASAALAPFASTGVLGGIITTSTGIIDVNHPGVQVFNSVAGTANSGHYVTSFVATNPYSTIFTNGLQADLIFKLPAVTTNNYFRFGHQLGSITVALPIYGNYFEVTDTTIVGITRSSNVQSSTSSFTLTANTWYHSRIKETVVGSTNTVVFTIYGMDGTVLYNQSSTTNISPTTTRALTIIGVNTVSATALPIIYLDYIGITFPAMIRGALN
jgi:hypothetical protein